MIRSRWRASSGSSPIGERILDRPQHERQRRAELVADVGEELRLQLVELGQFLALARNLALVGLLLGDVASFGGDEHDVAVLVLHRHERGIDDDGLFAAGAAVDRRVPANEFALRGAPDRLPQRRVDLRRDLPPEGCPERLALDVGERDADGVERDLVDFEHRALGIEQADELDHGVERDARDLLPIGLARIAGQKLGAADVDEVGGYGRIGRHLTPKLAACRMRPQACC